jgi:penicillin-binding protein 1A
MSRCPRALPIILALALFAGSGCAELARQLTDLPKLKKSDLDFRLAQSSKIYDNDGNLITSLHEVENRTIVPIHRIPEHVQNAVISIEDERFYEHQGVDVRAILRALVANATSGQIKEGGSTITQQLVKNLIISPGETAERTLERKITEAAYSRQLEKKWTKKKILEAYLNTVYFGEGAYGVQEAAKTYFGRPVSDLTLSQAATLAGIIQAPEDYDAYKHPRASKGRRDIVISKMLELGHIDQAQADEARSRKIALQKVSAEDTYPAPYFIDYVQRLITYDPRFAFLGESIEQRTKRLFRGGLRIHTTVDLDMQAAADDAVASILPNPEDPHASLVAIDPKTGEVRAMVGGRDWFASPKQDPFSKLNLAIVAEPNLGCVHPDGSKKCVNVAPGTGRQAGSAFKPFALVTAIDEGISLANSYKAGSSITIPGANAGADYIVHNYEGGSFGDNLSLLEATVFSVNVVYAQVINDVGPEDVAQTAYDMGINTPLCESCLSSVLGSNEINPLDMASAFGTLATNGTHHPPVAITRITTADGEVLYEDESESKDVVEPSVAYLATTALEQVIQRGTAARYGNIGRPAAGKTGTAQEYRDAWFIGYTPDLVASVWMGYPEGQIEMKPSCSVTMIGDREVCRPTRSLTGSGVTGGSYPTQIWAAFMLKALAGVPASSFVQPSGGFVTVAIDTRKPGCLANKLTPPEFRQSATFAAGTEPEKSCRIKGDTAEVPDVVGFPIDEAAKTIERAGFIVNTVDQPTREYPPGVVLDQNPAGGSKAPQGSSITLAVSVKGDEDRVTVPSVLGMTAHEAQDALRADGFTVVTIRESESNKGQAKKNSGRVWKQSPSSGTETRRGATVTIWVNP